MNILGYLQKIGRALMVPVATLPAAAIMMGIGYWIDPQGWGSGSAAAALLIKAGAAIIDNMSMLFAVGVAYGMSRDKDGAAALAGLVGYYVLTTLLSPAAVAQIQGIPLEQVPKAFGKIHNQFVGILSGVIAAELYNRFSQVELHKALAFFSGRRLVPIVTSFVMIFVAFALMAVWPVIYNGLVAFGLSIKDMGAAGAGIYAFFNRLLIPIGLHHALNSVFWFDVAGINDIPNFLGGAKSLAEGKAVLGVTGMYQAGFFPIMMFGLPGAALAIYHTSKAQNKARVASIMIAAGFASFFTGVTEPLEFSFMFVAPLLYLLHAFLAGLSVYIAASMHWMSGFGFSAGMVDMVLSSRNPLANHWYMLIVQGVAFFGVYYSVFRTAIRALNLKTPGREDDEVGALSAPVAASSGSTAELAQAYISVIGGAANVLNVDACITRLRLTVKDADQVDAAGAKSLGASGVIKLNQQSVQIVVGPRAELIADSLRQQLAGVPAVPAAAPARAAAAALPAVAAVLAAAAETVLLAPVSGEVLALADVPDAAFASKAVGEGVAIRPTGKLVVAPCAGKLVSIFNTNHAFALVTEAGAEIIVHIGIETVKLGGQGFKRLAQVGADVKAGDPVLELDLDYLAAHAVSTISPVVLSNADEFGALT
ncbi:MAG: N-acetylglucosamine-specific PTS transporter subunit IIBC, partial [Betaproteobacteria bacterium]